MFYIAKLKWLGPKEGTDEMKRYTKQYLVYAESVTEAEARMLSWVPSNYQDPVIEEVKKTPIEALNNKTKSETFWLVKLIDDADGREKPRSFYSLVSSHNAKEAISVIESDFVFTEIDELKKFKAIVDEDLIDSSIEKMKKGS